MTACCHSFDQAAVWRPCRAGCGLSCVVLQHMCVLCVRSFGAHEQLSRRSLLGSQQQLSSVVLSVVSGVMVTVQQEC
jgi:hypothetical protein